MENRRPRLISLSLAIVAAALGIVLAWRAYNAQDDVAGYVSEDTGNSTPPEYPRAHINEPDPPFPENVEREVMPVFNVSAGDLPVDLDLPAQSLSESFLVEGELTHDDPRFNGGLVELSFLYNGARAGGKAERSVREEGRHVYRLACEVPPRSGQYLVQIEVTYKRMDVDPSESPRREHLAIILLAEGTIEFRE